MSVIIQPQGEVGGGVADHLQCSHCGHFSKSHAEQLSHLAAYHPTCLDGVAVGRLGHILMYQSSARLFHCFECFYTSRDFAKLYKHIITKHCIDKKEGAGGGGDPGGEGEKGNVKDDGGKEEVKDAPNRKSSEEEEQSKGPESVKIKNEGVKKDLIIDGGSFRCLICGWRNKHKAASVSHMVLKHKVPKCDALQALKWEAAALTKTPGGVAEDEEGAGLSEEMLKKEIEASAKVISFVSTRYICLICGWKTKIQACITGHVVRSHNVECPYRCEVCSQSFFLPSQLQHHIRSFHRPGRFACPFCSFRSECVGGLKWHCSRCNTREQGGEATEVVERPNEKRLREARRLRNTEMIMIDNTMKEEDEEEEVRKTRKQRSTKMMIRILKKEDDD